MEKLPTKTKWWLFIGGIVIVIAVYFILSWLTPQMPTALPNDNLTTVNASSTTTSTATAPSTTGTKVAATQNRPVSPIRFITPTTNAQWTFDTQNVISWTNAGNVSGQLYLINAKTKKFVGTILNEVGPQQTSFTWNTRDLLVSRTIANKLTVAPGTYAIVLSYDGNHLSPVTSQTFEVIQ